MEGKAEKLFEVEATSDKIEGKAGKAVRSRAIFGQVWREKQKSCQNLMQLRTGLERRQEKLSEVKVTSDRFIGKQQKAVRT